MKTLETHRAINDLKAARYAIGDHRRKLRAARMKVMDAWDSTGSHEERRDLSRTWGELHETTCALTDTLREIDTQLATLRKDVDA